MAEAIKWASYAFPLPSDDGPPPGAGGWTFVRGNAIYWIVPENRYVYADGTPYDPDHDRPCVHCGRLPTPEGYDACLGHLPGVKAACCGHGVLDGYVMRENEEVEAIA